MMRKEDFSVFYWGVAGAGKISTDFVSAVQTDSPDKHKVSSMIKYSIINHLN